MRKKVILLVIIVLIAIIGYSLYPRSFNLYYNNVEKYQSASDMDQDGIKDNIDIYKSAIAYIETRPKYESKYYNTGYPDDGYGVCSDVVAFAFKEAGYDLMQLVHEDIMNHPDRYDDTVGDIHIDFRRVKNLQVYFQYHATSLTTDIKDINAWQAGDVVIFPNHIGIISDYRDQDGVPYVIHAMYKGQLKYETDYLKKGEIIAHYRYV